MEAASVAIALLSVAEIAALSDDALGQFMSKNRRLDGHYDLPVGGWEELSKDERDRLAERLKAQERHLAQSQTACSRPLDLDDLDARLHQISPDQSLSPRPETRTLYESRSPTPPYDPTKVEVEAYHDLVNDGGCPLYSVDIIRKVFQDPDSYAELLRPWQVNLSPVSPSGIFQKQLRRWRDFRNWQNDNRGLDDDDGGFSAYIEQKKHAVKRDFRPEQALNYLNEIESGAPWVKSVWEDQQWARERQRRFCREHGCRGFLEYASAVKRRLLRHSFAHQFQLDENPRRQDRLVTWIEYLNYEYWWLDQYSGKIERLEPEHEKLWQALVDEKILRPHETKEFVRTAASPTERQNEADMAQKAVEQAQSEAEKVYALTQKDPKCLIKSRSTRVSMMKHCTDQLLAAKRHLKQIRDRNARITQFIRSTFDYDEAKRDAGRHRILVQWVLDQVPLIEAEANTSKACEPDSGRMRRSKRGRSTDEDPSEGQDTKRLRFNLREPSLSSAKISVGANKALPGPSTVMNKKTAQPLQPRGQAGRLSSQQNAQPAMPGPRRSARIAAQREAARIALEPHTSRSASFSKPEPTPAQPSRSRSRMLGHKANATKGKSQSGRQGGIAKPIHKSHRRQQKGG